MFPAVNKPVDSFAASNRARFSTAEFLRMVDADVFEDERVELIDRWGASLTIDAGDAQRVVSGTLGWSVELAEL